MEVLEQNSAWLCDFEVYQHLLKNKENRGDTKKSFENILTIEFEVNEKIFFNYLKLIFCLSFKALKYFSKTSPSHNQSKSSISNLLEYLKDFKLTKAEKLQIVNFIPRTPVDFYLVK
jgi:hypothetical protein